MAIQKHKFSSLVLPIAFVVCTFLLFFIVSISYKQNKALTASQKWIVHSQKVRVELHELLSNVKDAEIGQRGYLLTHDADFLKPFNGAFEKINQSFIRLKVLVSDNIDQKRNLDTLYGLVTIRFKTLSKIIDNSNSEFQVLSSLKQQLSDRKTMIDEICFEVDKMIAHENKLLKQREKKHKHELYLSPLFYLLIAFFSLMIFIIAFARINNGLRKLKRANNDLLIAQKTFDHAEQIAEISNWCWNIEDNTLVYSKNHYRLMGYEPYEFESTTDKFLEFVHPDDRHIILDVNQKVLTESTPSIAYFRVIRRDGTLRYFKSIGKIISDNYGKKLVIGVNADITEQYNRDKTLEERLFDLERSNAELSAFNHAASHDLQEPLRKIQIFISRILDTDHVGISEKGKEYFGRIQVAANRMQKLIDDLLLYSRSNKSDKVFEDADLNLLLENSKQELAQAIEDKNATIQSALLPVLNVIPFQIQQLFTNLISNSLKYSRPNIAPVISISAKIVSEQEIPNSLHNVDKKFYKISISDNGIGFDQKYSKNIFTLFHRLHDDSSYSGTGIGLTICKKIIENHKGHILAEAIPNQGATFHFYIPI